MDGHVIDVVPLRSHMQPEPIPTSLSSALDLQCATIQRPLNGGSPSPHSTDSNSNAPTSSQSLIGNALAQSTRSLLDGPITPSISLIPIKQVSFPFIVSFRFGSRSRDSIMSKFDVAGMHTIHRSRAPTITRVWRNRYAIVWINKARSPTTPYRRTTPSQTHPHHPI